MMNIRQAVASSLLALLLTVPFTVLAQAYPAKAVKLIVPFVPGGGADTIARIVSAQMQQRLGQPVIVENRPGAGGALAADLVARSPADGYTLLIVSNTFVTSPAITKTAYDPERDFTPVTTVGSSPYLLLVNAQSDLKTLNDVVRAGRAQPEKLSFGSAGAGGVTHLLGELFKQRAQFAAQHVPYKGTAQALVDLMGDQVQFAFADTASAIQHIRSGKLRALATTAPARSPLLPEVPTSAEAGVEIEVVGFYGMLGPAKLPEAVVSRLNSEMAAVLATAEVKERMAATLTESSWMPADEFTRRLRSEVVLWREVVKRSGSKFD